ncbi:MAG TPA: XRE family transcriptional regulator, partial [Desulfomonilaceae bacterium]|nr:XRE family transcriptional regulator [Desulfomonilaceae bacterium]
RGNLRAEFHDKEYRHAYADESLNTFIATQIKVLREQRDLTQKALADLTGMAQPRIAVLEDINYSSWSINTLRRLAEAFDLRLSVRFETFSSLIPEIESMSEKSLQRDSFEQDVWFHKKDVQPVTGSALMAGGEPQVAVLNKGALAMALGQSYGSITPIAVMEKRYATNLG